MKCFVRLCDPTGNHPDIPLLALPDYMTQEGFILTVNYKTQTVTRMSEALSTVGAK